jgi:putative MATE family efflux protein
VSNKRAIMRQLAGLAWPIVGLNVLNVLALAVDTAMCGRLENSETALAALSYSTQIIFLLMVAMLGLTVGTVATVARAHGAGVHDKVDHVLAQSSQLTIGLSLIIAVVGNLVAPQLLLMLGATEDSLDAGLAYLRPLITFTVFYYLIILYAGVLRGVGNTRLPFTIALASNALNVLLNYGFILGNMGFPALGIAGAAIGTVISQLFAALLMIVLLKRGAVPGVRLSLRPRPVDMALARTLAKVGWPAALDMVVLNAGFLAVVGFLGRLDEVAVAAHGVGLRIQALAFVPGMSVSQATGALVGQALGAGDVNRARMTLRASLVLCVLIMGVPGAVFIGAEHMIISIFDVKEATPLGQYAIEWIEVLGWGMPIFGLHMAFVGLLQGAGETMTSLRINVWTTFLVQIPLCWFLGFEAGLGPFGVWLAIPLAFTTKAALDALAYRSNKWAKVGADL